MSIKEYLAGAKQAGSVQKLMTPGLAVEFIQPWYTPLSTTPSTTGIAVGGIGSTFTATPAGTTPVMNVMPGVQVIEHDFPLSPTECALILLLITIGGIGFLVAICLLASVREKIEFADYPKAFEGFAIALVTGGLLSLAFMGFSGMKIF